MDPQVYPAPTGAGGTPNPPAGGQKLIDPFSPPPQVEPPLPPPPFDNLTPAPPIQPGPPVTPSRAEPVTTPPPPPPLPSPPARNAPPSDAGGPSVPISPPQKEVGPIDYAEADKVALAEGDEYWQQFAREIELEKEVAEMGGVEKIERGEVLIPEAIAKEMGIKASVTIETPIHKMDAFTVRGVALSDDQLSVGVKKSPSTGFRWLVEWFILQLKKAHYFVRSIKGNITRQRIANSV